MSRRPSRAPRACQFVLRAALSAAVVLAVGHVPLAAAGPKGGGGRGNVAPVISGTPPSTVVAGSTYQFVPTAYDANGDRLKFSVGNKPGWAVFDSATGRLRGVPSASQVGTYANITITVSDGRVKASLAPFSIMVQPSAPAATPNSAPSISGQLPSTVAVGQSYSFRPTASDANGDRLTFSIANRPSWTTFDPATGALGGTPTSSDVGTYSGIVVTVSDGALSASLAPATIVVEAPNLPPTIAGAPAASVVAGQQYSFAPRASDPEGRTLTFSIVNKPTWAKFDSTTGVLVGTPSNLDVGTYSNVSISVTDGTSTATLASFAITVQPAPLSGSAELYWQPPTQRTDGSALTTLAGYRIYYGTTRGTYPNRLDVPDPSISTVVLEMLAPATYYFVLTAYDAAGVESAYTSEVAKTVQ